MAKGYQANKEHQEAVAALGKTISKRAGFKCEWCGGKEELRPWEYTPELEPEEENLALLCAGCRRMADGEEADTNLLRSIRNALWSDVRAVSEGAARVMARSREPWIRDAIDESLIDDTIKAELLKGR